MSQKLLAYAVIGLAALGSFCYAPASPALGLWLGTLRGVFIGLVIAGIAMELRKKAAGDAA